MFDSTKNDKVRMITLIGMAVMIVAVAAKAATSSVLAAAAIHIAGLACFFVIEGVEMYAPQGFPAVRFFSEYEARRTPVSKLPFPEILAFAALCRRWINRIPTQSILSERRQSSLFQLQAVL